MTEKELQAQLEAEFKEILTESSKIIKQYIDERDEATKAELKDVIVEELSGIEGLNENLEKLQALADAFVKVFDGNEDGTVTADEIVAKLALLQANIDKVASDLANVDEKYADLTKTLEDSLKALEVKVSANEVNISKNTEAIAEVKSNIENNYFTKDQIVTALNVGTEAMVEAVKAVFYPTTEEGDGATL
jgi:flagellar motility protein MotE (MotC chaperone)